MSTDFANTTTHPKQDLKAGLRVTWVGLWVNVLLIAFKLVGGILGGSQALIADAVHSISDLFSDVVVLLGLRWGRKEADDDHPYGHGRIETIASAMVGLLLLAAGCGIAYNAILAIHDHRGSSPTLLAIAAAGASIVLKEIMYWYTVGVGKRIRSRALVGNAWHHRSDALSSVAVLIGLIAAYVNPDWHLADALAALLVSLFVFRIGWSLMWTAFRELADTAPTQEVIVGLQAMASEIPGVLQVHDVRARHSGPNLLVEMHVVVDGNLSVHAGHDIAEEVTARLTREVKAVEEVVVHIEPETELIELPDQSEPS
jgi:cation diffusion facilitator family transporter